MIGLLNLES